MYASSPIGPRSCPPRPPDAAVSTEAEHVALGASSCAHSRPVGLSYSGKAGAAQRRSMVSVNDSTSSLTRAVRVQLSLGGRRDRRTLGRRETLLTHFTYKVVYADRC